MNKKLTLLSIAFVLTLIVIGSKENSIIKPRSIPAPVAFKDDGIPLSADQINSGPVPFAVTEQPPYYTIPGLNTYMDYSTNGNSLNQLIVKQGSSPNGSNDTVIAVISYCDSSEATNANAGSTLRMRYNYSFNGGEMWEQTLGVDITSGQKSRFPDMYYTYIPGTGKTVIGAGRFWTPNPSTTQIGGCSYDAGLGVGSPTTTLITNLYHPGRDYFGSLRTDGKIAGIVQASDGPTTFYFDTLRYITFNPAPNTFSAPSTIFANNFSNQVCSYMLQACPQPGSQLLVAAFNYINEPGNNGNGYRSVRVTKSTNNGTNWGTIKEYGYTTPYVIAGDSCQPYWHEDIAFKPGTSDYYVVYPTWPYVAGNLQRPTDNKGWKICIQSPALNGEKPVVVADYQNIWVLNDTSKFNQLDYTMMHSNTAYLSHPSIGFSRDGSVIWVAFSVIQTDKCPGPPTYNGSFFYHDIYITKSIDGGNTWATPWNITLTSQYDELYPIIAANNNLNYSIYILFQSDKIPGCHSFIGNQTVQQTVDKVYTGFMCPSCIDGIRKDPKEIPDVFSLSQNYPNPFNPSTKIKFDIPDIPLMKGARGMDVRLTVYDILGREVTTLVNEQLKPGKYEVEWDGTKYSSGIYFYKLITNNFSDSKKMVLIK
jgi:hypothetical protein